MTIKNLSNANETMAPLRQFVTAHVAANGPDLSQRQMAVLLIVAASKPNTQTVRGLAQKLGVSKPAITRALDTLGALDWVRRKVDPMDRRSVFANVSPNGMLAVTRIAERWRDSTSVIESNGE